MRSERPITMPFRGRDPLDATPVPAPGVEARRDRSSLIQLRVPRTHRYRVLGFIERILGFRAYVRVLLDERGSAYWEQVDGVRNLHAIEQYLRERFGLKRDESERAVIEFTKALMLRGLVCLRLPNSDSP